ncbi:MAG TPA: DNA-processing protein DprA [Streptosporangiaceae bacterium]|nr:DNA-processing protein DprA [Streptosporangiaceae bacterium]
MWTIAYDPAYQGGTWVAWNGRYDMSLERARQVLDERAGGITSPHRDRTRLARAALTWLTEPGDPALGVLLDVCEPEEVLDAIRNGQLPGQCRCLADARQDHAAVALRRWRLRLPDLPADDAITGICRANSIRLICPEDAEWPDQVDALGHIRPCALWACGTADLAAISERSVAVVGSRTATGYGVHVAGEMAGDLAGQGWTIVSGGAYGIDAAAHRGALSTNGITIAMLPCGLDQPYPAGHAGLFDHVTQRGLLVSELPPGSRPRLRFRDRNRILAALSQGTVIIEAGLFSGALNTARHAAGLGRPVMAIPGPVTSAQSAGCHQLIREMRATLITDADDILDSLSAARPGSPG